MAAAASSSDPPPQKKRKLEMELKGPAIAHSQSQSYLWGLRGKRFGHLGAASGHLGRQYGGRSKGVARKKRDTWEVMQKLHAIAYMEVHGPSLTVLYFWGYLPKHERDTKRHDYLNRWKKEEAKLIRQSFKKGGPSHKACAEASHAVFGPMEEAWIMGQIQDRIDLDLPIDSNSIIGWGWAAAHRFGKADRFKGGRSWQRGFCQRFGLTRQVELFSLSLLFSVF